MEFKKTVFRWQFLLSFAAFMAVFVHIAMLNKAEIPSAPQYPHSLFLEISNPFITYLNAMGGLSNSYMAIVFPLIAMLICGDSLFLDYKTGFFQFSLARISFKDYMKSKMIAVSVVTFTVSLLFQVAAFLFSLLTSPYHLPTPISVENYMAPTVSTGFYITNAFGYIASVIFLFSLISVVFAMSGIAASAIFHNVFMVIGIPWVIYIFVGQSFLIISPFTWHIFKAISPLGMAGPFLFNSDYNLLSALLYWMVCLLLLWLLAYRQSLKKFKSGR